jgi:hypothetical protein
MTRFMSTFNLFVARELKRAPMFEYGLNNNSSWSYNRLSKLSQQSNDPSGAMSIENRVREDAIRWSVTMKSNHRLK